MEVLNIKLFGDPDIKARAVIPNEDVGDKNDKPFITNKKAVLKILYEEKGYTQAITIINERGYMFDGATIPFGIGKGNMKLLIPALYHDMMCEDKSLINYNRKLSSKVFKELLLLCGVNKVKAELMYLAVDNFQKLRKGWKK